MPLVKSPSESTLYAPTLNQVNQNQTNMVDQISNFVEGIWLQPSHRQSRDSTPQAARRQPIGDQGEVRQEPPPPVDQQPELQPMDRQARDDANEELGPARQMTDKIIVEPRNIKPISSHQGVSLT